jgi:hypothetical protein
MVQVPISQGAGIAVYFVAMTGIGLLDVKLLSMAAERTFVLAEPYLTGPPRLPLIEQRRIDATLSLPPLPRGDKERVAALEAPALPANVLAARLDFIERADLTERASTHIASAADALEPSSQPSSIAVRVYGYRPVKRKAVHSSSRYAAVTARDVFNREFGVLSVASQ